jgi:hypothetical protein
LVKGERRGYRVHYFVNQEAITRAQEQVMETLKLGEEKTGKSHEENQNDVA